VFLSLFSLSCYDFPQKQLQRRKALHYMTIFLWDWGQVAGMDSSLLDTIAQTKSNFDEITGGATAESPPKNKRKKKTQQHEQREKDRSKEMEAIQKKQQEDQERARAEAAEEMAEKESAMEKQRQEMLEKMQQLKAQMSDNPPKEKKEKKERKQKPPKDQASPADPIPNVVPDSSTTNTTIAPTRTDNLAAVATEPAVLQSTAHAPASTVALAQAAEQGAPAPVSAPAPASQSAKVSESASAAQTDLPAALLAAPALQVAVPALASTAVVEPGLVVAALGPSVTKTQLQETKPDESAAHPAAILPPRATAAGAGAASTPAPASQPVVTTGQLDPLPNVPEPTIATPAQVEASGTVADITLANITPEAPTSFITQTRVVETTPDHSVPMQKLEEAVDDEHETDDEEEENESDDDDEEMQRELQRQQEEMEAQIRQIEEQHRREMQAVRDQEEERLHKARLAATKELARVTSTHGSSDSEDFEEYGEPETHGVLTNIENTLSNTNSAVSGIQEVIKEQHDQMAKILEKKAQQSKAEISKTKASYQMKLAVGLFKAQAPPSATPVQGAAPPPIAPPKPPTPPPREETPLPLIQPLGKATTLPAGNAPTSGWLPTSRPPRPPSKRIRVLRGPAVLQKEYAEHLGGQHRISTPALPMQPWFAAPKKPPSLQFQPKNFYYGSDKPEQKMQRPSTARARLQRDGSQSTIQPNSVDSKVQMDVVCSGPPPREVEREVYESFFQDSSRTSRPRRPMSARIQRQNTDYQDALKKIHGGDRVDGSHVLLPIGTQVHIRHFGSDKNPLHVSQYKSQQWSEGFKGSPAKGRRRQESAYSACPPTTPRLKSGVRERQTGGMLASSPPVAWASGRDSKDPDFINTIVGSTSRLQIRPHSASNKGQGSQAGFFNHPARSRNESKSFTLRPPPSPTHKIQLF
jgi:hypothetical protein